MPHVVDADTHVDESEATWESLTGDEARYRPQTLSAPGPADGESDSRAGRWWFVDGRLQARAVRDEAHHPPVDARELHDVQTRLRDMDRLGVGTQVIFPTFFIRYDHRANPAGSLALTRAYNRWIAGRCAPTNGRLRWTAVLPLLDVDKAVDELRWAKAHGAVGFFLRGYDIGKSASDTHFFPIYAEAEALDMPVCFHTGHPGFPSSEWDRGFPVMAACSKLIASRIPDKFPRLRFGFVEAGASWIPYVLATLGAQVRSARLHERASAFELSRDLFRANRLFVALDPLDDVEYLVKLGLEDNLMIGTDYSHSDVSANLSALDEVHHWVDDGRIAETVARKILETNPSTFYGLVGD